MAYESTKVAVSKSQDDLRKILKAYGADRFSFTESHDHAEVAFVFGVFAVRMRVPIVPMSETEARAQASKLKMSQVAAVRDRHEVETRRVWRVLYWLTKTRMEAIEAGVETFEQAFLAHLLDEDSDRTVFEAMHDSGALRQLGSGA